MQQLRIPATQWDDELVTSVGASAASRARIFLNRILFRAMVFFCGAVAAVLHPLSRERAWQWVAFSARSLGVATGVEVKLFGLENLPAGPSVLTPNHASHYDIAALLGYLPGNNRFAAKKELFREPILGVAMKTLGMIPIDRDDPAKSIERLNRLEEGGRGAFSLVMFPEGTRSTEAGLQPFKKGAFALAIQLKRPIVPIAIHGTSGVMPRGRYLSIRPGTVVIEVLPPIETADLIYDDRERLCDQTRAEIFARLSRARETAE
ncbi:MAG: lysophospholipid acyltransferase family protein [Candidatus Binatia bacterium]|nr:lysophospholipid acyltransferase family protein [Candidatus Binatia bacterium]